MNFQEKRGGDGYRADTDFQKKEQKLYYSSLDILINISKFLDERNISKIFFEAEKRRERKKKDLFLTAVESG